MPPPLTPPTRGGEVRGRGADIQHSAIRPPSPDLRPPQSDTEELYRKTLEELKKLRQQEFREGRATPPAINEQLIQAGAKGKILGDESGRMGAGKPASPEREQGGDEQKPSTEKPKEPGQPMPNS